MEKNKQFLIVTILFALVIIINELIWEEMYEFSNTFAIWMQTNPSELAKSIMILITFCGEEEGIVLIIVWLWIISSNKIQVLKIVSMVSICSYIVAINKMLYRQPRPYYKNLQINSNNCPLDYGNPSGHSFVCIVFYTIVFETIIFKKFTIVRENTLNFIDRDNYELRAKFQKPKDDQEFYSQLYPSSFLTLSQNKYILYTFISLIGLSRIYLGAHSLNQVILGFVWGSYIIYVYKFKLEQFIEESFLLAIYEQFEDRKQLIKISGIVLVLYFALTVQAVLVFLYRRNDADQQQIQEEWIVMIKFKCPQFQESDLMFENKMLRDTGPIYFPLDVFLCLLYSKGTYIPSAYPNNIQFLRVILRTIVLALICAAPVLFLALLLFGTDLHLQIIFQYSLQSHVGVALITIGLIMVAPQVYKFLRLDVPGDLMRLNQGEYESQRRHSQGQLAKQELEIEL